MADLRYLKLRGGSWYYQRAVPRGLRHRRQGSHVVVRALHTQSLAEAQALRWKINAEVQAEFEVAAGGRKVKLPSPTEIEVEALAEFRNTLKSLDALEFDDENLQALLEQHQRKLDLADPAKVNPIVGRGVPSRIVDRDFALIRARIEAIEARRKALAGIVPDVPLAFGRKAIDPVTLQPILTSRGTGKRGPRFADVAARLIAEKQRDPEDRLTEQTRGQYEAAFRLFDSFAGEPCIGDIDRQKAAEFLDQVATLDANWGRSPGTKQRPFAEVMALFGNRQRGLSNKTVNRYAMALGMVWKYAVDRGEFEGANPWERQGRKITKRRGAGKTDKRGYQPDEIAKLLARKPAVAPNRHDAASALPWVILIAAYSGARLNEVCSLACEDVKQDGRIWYFDITAAKSEAGVRRVPVHSRILAAGLLQYRKRLGKGQLFPGLKPGGPDDKFGWYLSKRFTEHRRDLGIEDINPKTGKDQVDFHSLRRSVVTALKHARVPEHEVAEIVGHEHEKITFGVYADKQRLAELQRIVELIRYAPP